LRVLQALVAGLVEGLVVPAAGVRDHAGLVVARGTAGIAAAAGALLRGRAAGGEGQGAGAGQGESARDALHEGSFVRCVDGSAQRVSWRKRSRSALGDSMGVAPAVL